MAYSRFWDSDIYIYPSVLGSICCSLCLLYSKSINIDDDVSLVNHIQEHRAQGHNIPDDLEQEILSDPDRYGTYESLSTKVFRDTICKDCDITENSKE